MIDDLISLKVGKVVGVHGINGNLRLFSYLENEKVLSSIDLFLINKKKYKPLMLKKYKRGFLLNLTGVDNRELSEELVGHEIFADKKFLPKLDENSYYWNDLIGISVFENNKPLGKISSILETGANDVYVVSKGKEEILLPAIETYILSIDIEKKRMEVKLPNYF